ncbi:hypothetical protein OG698_18125 [Streptomyces sp. NBC_01003]|nr:hypothetical protein OG698_18125 [Streptomyces sp. NBC_01003]
METGLRIQLLHQPAELTASDDAVIVLSLPPATTWDDATLP